MADPLLDRDFLAAIVARIGQPIFVKDRDHRYVLANDALGAIVGLAPHEIIGRTDADFMGEEQARGYVASDDRIFERGLVLRIDEELYDVHGRVHLINTIKAPITDEQGRVTHVVGILQDLTELKAAEEALRVANEELEIRIRERQADLEEAQAELVRRERLAVLGQLAGGVAHQIRNPLAAISNAAYVLKKLLATHPDPDVARSIAIIHEESWQANRIITDLLDYARVRPAVTRPTDVRAVVEHALGALAIPSGVELVRAFDDEPPLVAIDAAQVRDALGNLLRNAVDAMPLGGTLSVAIVATSEHVIVSVADSGDGVDPDVGDRLFEPLVTTKPTGLGLGLVTARALIENQDGQLRWDREATRGAKFDVQLPIARLPKRGAQMRVLR